MNERQEPCYGYILSDEVNLPRMCLFLVFYLVHFNEHCISINMNTFGFMLGHELPLLFPLK